jgi:hypothetical protein
MAIDRDDREERQARLDWMINEFQEARRRRLVKPSDGTVEPHTETETKAVVTRQAALQYARFSAAVGLHPERRD